MGAGRRCVVGWAGMRGAVSLAAALAIPQTAAPVQRRPRSSSSCSAVIVLGMTSRALTLPVARPRNRPRPPAARPGRRARDPSRAERRALRPLSTSAATAMPTRRRGRLRELYETRLAAGARGRPATRTGAIDLGGLELLRAERVALRKLHGRGELADAPADEHDRELADLADEPCARGSAPAPPLATRCTSAAPPIMPLDLSQRDGPRDECGVFGIYAPEHDVARLAYFALYALQHRGQESAGIAAADRGGHIMTQRDAGPGQPGLQRARPARARRRPGDRPRPLLDDRLQRVGELAARAPLGRRRGNRREVALAHNGNLINAVELHAELRERGRRVQLDVGLGDHRRAARHAPGARRSRTRSPTCCRACRAPSRRS